MNCMAWVNEEVSFCGATPIIREWGEPRCEEHADMTMVAALNKLKEIRDWLGENNVNFPGLAQVIMDMEPEQ